MTGTFRYFLLRERVRAAGADRLVLGEDRPRAGRSTTRTSTSSAGDSTPTSSSCTSARPRSASSASGPTSKQADESNMTLEVTGVYAIFGVNITPTLRLSLGETLQRFEVARGGVPGLPFTGDLFPDLPGVQGATIHAQRVALIHDSRDSLTTPTAGALRQRVRRGLHRASGERRRLHQGGRGGHLPQALSRPPRDRRPAGALRGHLRGVEHALRGAAHAGRRRHRCAASARTASTGTPGLLFNAEVARQACFAVASSA